MKETITDIDIISHFSFFSILFFQFVFLFVSFIKVKNFLNSKGTCTGEKKWNYSVTYYCLLFSEQ